MKKGTHLKKFKIDFLYFPTKQHIILNTNEKTQIIILKPNKILK
jgi:hypothetical protein